MKGKKHSGQIRILIVEDESINLEVMQEMVENHPDITKWNCSVSVASDGQKGWDLFQEIKPDIVLTDIRMPKLDGITLAKKIRAVDPEVQTVVITSYNDSDYLLEALNFGVRFFLMKPIMMEQLFEMLKDCISRIISARLLRQQNQKLRFLAAELSLAEERERRRIASQLHDQVGQDLALSLIKLEMLKRSLPEEQSLNKGWDELKEVINNCIRATRTLTFELSPPMLYELGVESAIRWYADRLTSAHSVRIDVECSELNKIDLTDERKYFLYRSIRELLVNAVKHADCDWIRVGFKKDNTNLIFTVEDDGKGFEAASLHSLSMEKGSFGLFSIQQRLDFSGGELRIEKPEKGTRIRIILPLKTEN